MTPRKLIQYVLVTICAIVSLGLVLQIVLFYKTRNELSEIPDIALVDYTTNQPVSIQSLAKGQSPCVFFFFHPDCDICAIEVSVIIENKDQINNAIKIFITTADVSRIQSFLSDYPINELANSYIIQDTAFEFVTKYNLQSPPVCIFYDKNGRLIKKSVGFTKFDVIKNILNNY